MAPPPGVAPARGAALSLQDRVLTGHRFPIYALAFSPDGRRLASGSLDRTARLWDLEEGREIGNVPGTSPCMSIDFSADGRMLAVASTEQTDPVSSISICNVDHPRELRTLTGHRGRCMCVRFHPDGHLLASTEGGMTVHIWDVASGRIIRTLAQGFLRAKTFGGPFRCSLAFSPNGRHLATRSWPVTIWDVYEGKQVMTLGGEWTVTVAPVFIAFSPDGQQLVEVRSDATVRIWQVYREEVLSVLGAGPDGAGGPHRVISAALSRDWRHLAVGTSSSEGGRKYAVTVWDLASSRRLATFAVQDGSQALAFSPDGHWLALTDTTYGNGQASGVIMFRAIDPPC